MLDDRHKATIRRLAFCVVIGLVGAVIGGSIEKLVLFVNSLWHTWPWLLYLLPLFAVAGIFLYEKLGLKTWVGTVDGPSELLSDARENTAPNWRLAPAVVGGTCLTLLGGGVVGPDAAVKQTGAVAGPIVARFFKLDFSACSDHTYELYKKIVRWCRRTFPHATAYKDRTHPCSHTKDEAVGPVGFATLAGLGAAFSALLGAPLGILAYTLEIARQNHARVKQVYSLALACFVGAGVALAAGTAFSPTQITPPMVTPEVFWRAIVVGLCAGLLGVLYRGALTFCNRVVRKRLGNPYLSVLIGGILVAALIQVFNWEAYAGLSVDWLAKSFAGGATQWGFLVVWLLVTLSLGMGLRGGEVTIVFIMGALLGGSVANAMGIEPGPVCAVALGSFFAVASGCPVAGLFCTCEFYGWSIFVPALIGIVVASVTEHLVLDRFLMFAIDTYGPRINKLAIQNWAWHREDSTDTHPGTDHIMKH
jgi:H+/Cl- antiporter ClcA